MLLFTTRTGGGGLSVCHGEGYSLLNCGIFVKICGDRGLIGVTKQNFFTLFARLTLNCAIVSSRNSSTFYNKTEYFLECQLELNIKFALDKLNTWYDKEYNFSFICFTRSRSNPKNIIYIYIVVNL